MNARRGAAPGLTTPVSVMVEPHLSGKILRLSRHDIDDASTASLSLPTPSEMVSMRSISAGDGHSRASMSGRGHAAAVERRQRRIKGETA